MLAYAPATADVAALLAVEPGAELIVREIRATTTRLVAYITTSYLPAGLANGIRLVEPDVAIGQLDGVLADLGHLLALTERVTARMPTPDERDTFDLREGVPLLRATRITTDTRDDVPLEVRVTLLPAEGVELEYHPTPTGTSPNCVDNLRVPLPRPRLTFNRSVSASLARQRDGPATTEE